MCRIFVDEENLSISANFSETDGKKRRVVIDGMSHQMDGLISFDVWGNEIVKVEMI
jgi:hypothetical protein